MGVESSKPIGPQSHAPNSADGRIVTDEMPIDEPWSQVSMKLLEMISTMAKSSGF